MKLRDRPLWKRHADTQEGEAILNEARHLATYAENENLTDGELIRLVYWGVSGEQT